MGRGVKRRNNKNEEKEKKIEPRLARSVKVKAAFEAQTPSLFSNHWMEIMAGLLAYRYGRAELPLARSDS